MAKRLKPRSTVTMFAQEMERQLRANDHKNGWYDMTHRALLKRLREETTELQTALGLGKCAMCRCGCFPPGNIDSASVVREAADVANFAMMLADNVVRSDQ